MAWKTKIDIERENESYIKSAKDFIDSTPLGKRNSEVFSKNGRKKGLPGVWPDSMAYLTVNKIAPDFDRDKGLYLFRQNVIYPLSTWGQSEDFLAYLVMDEEQYKSAVNLIEDKTPIDSKGFMNRFIVHTDYYDFASRELEKDFKCRTPLILAYKSGNGYEGYIGGDVHPSATFSVVTDRHGWTENQTRLWSQDKFNPNKVKELMTFAKRKAEGIEI